MILNGSLFTVDSIPVDQKTIALTIDRVECKGEKVDTDSPNENKVNSSVSMTTIFTYGPIYTGKYAGWHLNQFRYFGGYAGVIQLIPGFLGEVVRTLALNSHWEDIVDSKMQLADDIARGVKHRANAVGTLLGTLTVPDITAEGDLATMARAVAVELKQQELYGITVKNLLERVATIRNSDPSGKISFKEAFDIALVVEKRATLTRIESNNSAATSGAAFGAGLQTSHTGGH